MTQNQDGAAWLLLIFSLPTKRASLRVDVWRRLRRAGALPLRNSGYVLPNSPASRERFQWLAGAIRKSNGKASVVEVAAIDNLPHEKLVQLFLDARCRDYEKLARELRKKRRAAAGTPLSVARWRRRFQEIIAIDYFNCPLRSRVEALLAETERQAPLSKDEKKTRIQKEAFRDRIWVTRPRPGIDRISSAWLIRKYIDPAAKFAFADDAKQQPDAVAFDMFGGTGFSHRGESCTFETLAEDFHIVDPKVLELAQVVHDADLDDDKFGRSEGKWLERVLIGWARMGLADDDLLERGINLIEGLYAGLP